VAAVCSVIVLISLIVERSLRLLGKDIPSVQCFLFPFPSLHGLLNEKASTNAPFLHKLPPISPLYKYYGKQDKKKSFGTSIYIYIMAMKIGLWKFTWFDFDSVRLDNCMEMVFLVCRVENHVFYGTAGESVC